ncbi:MAG: hypothetical protein IJI04_02330 [Lachnospiraceae bacterium]|nr:hypothetical protein [Lachnospiraceae bacterium]
MTNTFRKLLSLLLTTVLILNIHAPVMAAESDGGYIFGSAEYYSTYTSGKLLTDSFYYSDEWFGEDPFVQNDSLALLSMQLTASAVPLDVDTPVANFLGDLGFDTIGFSSLSHEDPWTCNYAWATKTITLGDETRTLAAVIIQSHSDDQPDKQYGWTQNFIVNDDSAQGDHYGLSVAASSILGDVASLGDGNTTYWIMGHSRGGAIAGLVAAHLPEVDPRAAGNIFAYTFEAPRTVDSAYVPDNGDYFGYIHNYVCSDDAVTEIPPWDMVRYGVDHQLDTDEANADLFENLAKIGSDAVEKEDSYVSGRNALFNILDAIVHRIPERPAYSDVNIDCIIDPIGNEMPIDYVYQDTIARAVAFVTSDGLGGISMEAIMDEPNKLIPVLGPLVMAVKYDSPDYYWSAATALSGFLYESGIELPLDEVDIYVLLKLIGPYLINADAVPDELPESAAEYLLFLNVEALSLLGGAKDLAFSHQFDTVIARLMTLAEMPLLEDIDIRVPEPQIGDDVSGTPLAVSEDILSRGNDWLSVSSEWNTDEEVLSEGGVYYLTVELQAIGHVAPDDYRLTLNGEEPVGPLEMSFANGIQTVIGTFAFAFGEAQRVTVSFDASGLAQDPEPVQVTKGSRLGLVLEPSTPEDVADGEVIWRFTEWQKDGTSWENVTATEDITLTAGWQGCISEVALTYEAPHAGENAGSPTVPAGVRYKVQDASVYTAEYRDAPSPLEEGDYIMNIYLVPTEEGLEFLSEEDEYGFFDYTGTILMNGEPISCYYDMESNTLSMEYSFTTLPQEITYRCTAGDGNEWTKGSGIESEFTFSRSVDDESTFAHFTGIQIDGEDVAETNYAAEAGSVNIRLSSAYLETLSEGEHTLTAVFDDGSAEAVFVVLPAKEEGEDDSDDSGKTDDGKDDPGKTDDGKDDSGKTDNGKDDSGKTDDGKNPSGGSKSGSSGKSGNGSGSSSGGSKSMSGSSGNSPTIAPRSTAVTAVSRKSLTTVTSGNGTSKAANTTKNAKSAKTAKGAATGDESQVLLWAAVMVMAMAVIRRVAVYKR